MTVEPGTPLARAVARGAVRLPDDDTVAERLEWAWHRLCGAGLEQYEVSSFCRPGRRCAHNLNYWRYGDYLGLGAAAVSKLGDRRSTAPRRARAYVEAVQASDPGRWAVEDLDPPIQARERAMLALRTADGVGLAELTAAMRAAGLDDRAGSERLGRLEELGLLARRDERVLLTRRGMLLSNPVLADLTVP